jgi:hypothetical protein
MNATSSPQKATNNASSSAPNATSHLPANEDIGEQFQAIWHISLLPCLLKVAEKQEEARDVEGSTIVSIVRMMWDLDFKLHVLDPKEIEDLASVSKQFATATSRGLLTYFDGTYEFEWRTLKEEQFHETDLQLQFDYEFDYRVAKKICYEEVERDYRPRIQPLVDELRNGCGGQCGKIRDRCAEPLMTMCPEGTRCKCMYEANPTTAMKWSIGTFFTIWMLNSVVFWHQGGPMLPGPTEGALVVSFLMAYKTVGCSCQPLECKWNRRLESCVVASSSIDLDTFPSDMATRPLPWLKKSLFDIEPQPWGKNPFMSKLPFPGFKCEPHATFGLLGREQAEPLCQPVPCSSEDYDASAEQPMESRIGSVTGLLGNVGKGVYNCWKLTNSSLQNAAIVHALPQHVRAEIYSTSSTISGRF